MGAPPGDGSRREPSRRVDDLERRERELERFRANIERLRRERQAALDEFDALTRGTHHQGAASLDPVPATGDPATLPEPDVLTGSAASSLDVPPADEFDRLPVHAEAVLAGVPASGDTVDLPDEPVAVAPLPDDEVDFAALTEEDTIIDSAPRRAADRRRTVVFSLVGAATVALLAWALWGPWSHRRTAAPPVTSPPTGEHVAVERAEAAPPPPASVEPAARVDPAAPASGDEGPREGDARPPAPASPLVVQLVVTRPVWVRATVDGAVVVNRRVEAGDTVALEAGDAVSVRVGDAGAVRLVVNGRDRGLAGRDGQVRTVRFAAAEERER